MLVSGEPGGPDEVPWSALDAYPAASPPEVSVEGDLAYILYTSGSTGQPKGVMLTHRNALTFVDWCAATFSIRPEDHLSNHAPLHFDLSVFDVYNAIEAGAAVSMIPEETALFPQRLAAFIADAGHHGVVFGPLRARVSRRCTATSRPAISTGCGSCCSPVRSSR